jgi:hypothetical protein
LKQAKYKIQLAAHEPVYPLAARGKKNKDGNREGGLNSHGMTKEERQEMYRTCQDEINRLVLEKGHEYTNACRFVAKRINDLYPLRDSISFSSIIKNTTNPR